MLNVTAEERLRLYHRKASAGKGLVTFRGLEGTVASPSWEMFGKQLWHWWPTKPCQLVPRAPGSVVLGRLPATLWKGTGGTGEQGAPYRMGTRGSFPEWKFRASRGFPMPQSCSCAVAAS